MPTSQSKSTQCTVKQIHPSSENKMKFAGEPSPVQEMHWHNVNAGSPHSRSKDANAKMSTSKSQTTRYDVVNEIERSNSEYQDVRVYAMKSIRLMYVHRLPIDRSLYVCASARCRAHKHLHAPQCTDRSREASCSALCLLSHRQNIQTLK